MGLLDIFSGGRYERAENLGREAADIYDTVALPDIEQMRVQLEGLVQQGVYTPEEAQAALQQATEMGGISTDPRLREAQMTALSRLQALGDTGIDAIDRGRLNAIAADEATRERGSREAILQNAAMRGLGGSGLELSAQLANQQGGATRASQRGFDVAAEAQQRALQAIQGAGGLAGQIRGQSWQEQAERARAQDLINQFNARQRQDVGMANVGARNIAQQQNLGERQRVADVNAQTRNQGQMYNKQLLQQQFQSRMAKAAGKSGALQNAAAGLAGAGNAGVGLGGDIFKGLVGGAMTGVGYGLTRQS